MSNGYIDSASMYEILSIYKHDQPEDVYPWAWNTSLEVTCSLINVNNLIAAPEPDISTGASGLFGHLTNELSLFIDLNQPMLQDKHAVVRNTKMWAGRYPEKVRLAYDHLMSDRDNFPYWIENSINNIWPEHSKRLGGLFHPNFIPQMSKILCVDEPELEKMWKLSCKPKFLDDYAKHKIDREKYKTLKDAYIVSALIRGRYQDNVAASSKTQILHHPLRRQPSLYKPTSVAQTEYGISNVEIYLSSIILAGAYAEKDPKKRVSCYAENVSKAKIAVKKEKIDTRQKDSNDTALDIAIKSAKELKIRAYPKWVENAIDIGLNLGVLSLSSFVLSPWASLPLELFTYAVTKKINVAQKSSELLFNRKKRLRDLARSMPGRIEPVWN